MQAVLCFSYPRSFAPQFLQDALEASRDPRAADDSSIAPGEVSPKRPRLPSWRGGSHRQQLLQIDDTSAADTAVDAAFSRLHLPRIHAAARRTEDAVWLALERFPVAARAVADRDEAEAVRAAGHIGDFMVGRARSPGRGRPAVSRDASLSGAYSSHTVRLLDALHGSHSSRADPHGESAPHEIEGLFEAVAQAASVDPSKRRRLGFAPGENANTGSRDAEDALCRAVSVAGQWFGDLARSRLAAAAATTPTLSAGVRLAHPVAHYVSPAAEWAAELSSRALAWNLMLRCVECAVAALEQTLAVGNVCSFDFDSSMSHSLLRLAPMVSVPRGPPMLERFPPGGSSLIAAHGGSQITFVPAACVRPFLLEAFVSAVRTAFQASVAAQRVVHHVDSASMSSLELLVSDGLASFVDSSDYATVWASPPLAEACSSLLLDHMQHVLRADACPEQLLSWAGDLVLRLVPPACISTIRAAALFPRSCDAGWLQAIQSNIQLRKPQLPSSRSSVDSLEDHINFASANLALLARLSLAACRSLHRDGSPVSAEAQLLAAQLESTGDLPILDDTSLDQPEDVARSLQACLPHFPFLLSMLAGTLPGLPGGALLSASGCSLRLPNAAALLSWNPVETLSAHGSGSGRASSRPSVLPLPSALVPQSLLLFGPQLLGPAVSLAMGALHAAVSVLRPILTTDIALRAAAAVSSLSHAVRPSLLCDRVAGMAVIAALCQIEDGASGTGARPVHSEAGAVLLAAARHHAVCDVLSEAIAVPGVSQEGSPRAAAVAAVSTPSKPAVAFRFSQPAATLNAADAGPDPGPTRMSATVVAMAGLALLAPSQVSRSLLRDASGSDALTLGDAPEFASSAPVADLVDKICGAKSLPAASAAAAGVSQALLSAAPLLLRSALARRDWTLAVFLSAQLASRASSALEPAQCASAQLVFLHAAGIAHLGLAAAAMEEDGAGALSRRSVVTAITDALQRSNAALAGASEPHPLGLLPRVCKDSAGVLPSLVVGGVRVAGLLDCALACFRTAQSLRSCSSAVLATHALGVARLLEQSSFPAALSLPWYSSAAVAVRDLRQHTARRNEELRDLESALYAKVFTCALREPAREPVDGTDILHPPADRAGAHALCPALPDFVAALDAALRNPDPAVAEDCLQHVIWLLIQVCRAGGSVSLA